MKTRQQIQQELNTIAMLYGDRVHLETELKNEIKALHERLTTLKKELQGFPPELGPMAEPKKNEPEAETNAPSDQPA